MNTFAHKIVGVQPMSEPLGVSYAMRTVYNGDFLSGVDMGKRYYTIDWTAGMIQSRPSYKHPVPHHAKKDTDTIQERRNREYHNDFLPKKKTEFKLDNERLITSRYVPYDILYRKDILKTHPIEVPSSKYLYEVRRRMCRFCTLPIVVGAL